MEENEVFISIQAFPALLDVTPSCEIKKVSCGSRHTAAVTSKKYFSNNECLTLTPFLSVIFICATFIIFQLQVTSTLGVGVRLN